MKTIELQVARPMMFAGHRAEIGQRIQADPLTAGAVLHAGRATLVDAADQVVITNAVAAQADHACREAQRSARRFGT